MAGSMDEGRDVRISQQRDERQYQRVMAACQGNRHAARERCFVEAEWHDRQPWHCGGPLAAIRWRRVAERLLAETGEKLL